jgi:hypothetical protein
MFAEGGDGGGELSNEGGAVESAVSRRIRDEGGGRERGNCRPATAAVN